MTTVEVRRVYTERLKADDPRVVTLKKYSDASVKLYNAALRLALILNKRVKVQAKAGHFYGKRLSFYDLYSFCGKSESRSSLLKVEYDACPEGQEVLAQVAQDLDSYWKAKAAFFKNPGKFTGKPRCPRKKTLERGCVVTVPRVPKGGCYRPRTDKIKFTIPSFKVKKLNQVRFVKKGDTFNIEVVYTADSQVTDKIKGTFIALDPGVNNLYTTAGNSTSSRIVNGKDLLAVIKYYNFKIDRLKSKLSDGQRSSKQIRRFWTRMNDKISSMVHKKTRVLVNFVLDHEIETVIVGKNKDQKREGHLKWFNKMNHARILEVLKYKLEAHGITVRETEESYTSKCDNLAKNFLPKIAAGKSNKPEGWMPTGKRVKRGLYQSQRGLLNADVNGAIGIARKLIGDDWIDLASGHFFNPVRLR